MQSLILEDRALIEHLIRLRHAHGLLGKNAERTQKLVWESDAALEAYWRQVRTLEVHLAYADGLYVRSILTRFDVRRELIGAYRKKQVERMTDAGGGRTRRCSSRRTRCGGLVGVGEGASAETRAG